MTPVAIVMLIVAILVVWGGLVLSIVFLVRHPLDESEDVGTLLGGEEDEPHRAL
ncbi:methionine/alanine import family NSS transporter small subunit [Georgenia sp. AZ-5]|uniref:methionine/alanine import family NSS transporter small subunit n=1 Tax=Georgenia sp. AZ-5 TaxID=3367526 RepID=UPI00375424E9